MKKVWVDFNNTGIDGVRLNCQGTLDDLNKQGVILRDGLKLIIWDDDIETDSTVKYSVEDKCWVAKIST